MKFSSINTRVLDSARFRALCNFMRKDNITVTFATETHLSNDQAQTLAEEQPDFGVRSCKMIDKPRNGCTIIYRKDQLVETTETADGPAFEDPEGRLLVASFTDPAGTQTYTLACVYSPAVKEDRTNWFRQIIYRLQNNPLSRPVDIIGGDWNGVTDIKDKLSNKNPPRAYSLLLREFLTTIGAAVSSANLPSTALSGRNDLPSLQPTGPPTDPAGQDGPELPNLLVDGWRRAHPRTIDYTWRDHAGRFASRIDRIYIRDDWFLNTANWSHRRAGEIKSDHSAVLFTLDLSETVLPRGPGRWRLPTYLLKRSDIVNICLDGLKLLPLEDPVAEWFSYKATIKEQLQAFISKQRHRNNKVKRRFTKKTNQLVAKRTKVWHRLQQVPEDPDPQDVPAGRSDPDDQLVDLVPDQLVDSSSDQLVAPPSGQLVVHDQLVAIEQEIHAVQIQQSHFDQCEEKRYFYNALSKKLLTGERPSRAFFAKVKKQQAADFCVPSLRDPAGHEETAPYKILGIVEQFYGNLYSEKPSEKAATRALLAAIPKKIDPSLARATVSPVKAVDIGRAIKRAKSGSSPGDDGLPAEFYKALVKKREPDGSSRLLTVLTTVFNIFIKTPENIPATFNEGILAVFWKKKGDRADLKNYRPLSIMNSDYKIFTTILMTRMLPALDSVIGPEQTAFIPGRLIDDNVRTVQAAIALYRTEKRPLSVVFLDQEKAYDRVSHKYMWKVLRKYGFPDLLVAIISCLYKNASLTAMINGFRSNQIPVDCGVRQGDPLSCPLFIITFEPATDLIKQDPLITGLDAVRPPVREMKFADDWVWFPKTRAELERYKLHADTYARASGARTNWSKCAELQVFPPRPDGGQTQDDQLVAPPAEASDQLVAPTGQLVASPAPTGTGQLVTPTDQLVVSPAAGRDQLVDSTGPAGPTPAIRLLAEDEVYLHLGIPVGLQPKEATKAYWAAVRERFVEISTNWSHMHLSIKGRTLIANVLMMSIPRYALRFLPLDVEDRRGLDKAYYDLIWDNTYWVGGRDNQPLLPYEKGGLAAMDIESIQRASHLAFFSRMEKRPDLPWVQLTRQLFNHRSVRTKKIHTDLLERPWFQRVAANEGLPPGVGYIWQSLKRELGQTDPVAQIIVLRPPQTKDELLNINFWYHPELQARHGHGVKRFASKLFTALAVSGRRRLGDLWDDVKKGPVDFSYLTIGQTAKAAATELQRLFDDLPDEWNFDQLVVRSSAPWNPGPEFQQMCLRTKDGTLLEVQDVSFSDFYKTLKWHKVGRNEDYYQEKTAGVREAFKGRTGRTITDRTIWKAVRAEFGTPRIGDLLWRLLHRQVHTGDKLEWLPVERRRCPHCPDSETTLRHIFATCAGAHAVWAQFIVIWLRAAPEDKEFKGPTSVEEMVAFLAVSPFRQGTVKDRRWRILYGTAVWCLWKQYLEISFAKNAQGMSAARAPAVYKSLVNHRIFADRASCLNLTVDDRKYNPRTFAALWCQNPRKMRLRDTPWILCGEVRRPSDLDEPAGDDRTLENQDRDHD